MKLSIASAAPEYCKCTAQEIRHTTYLAIKTKLDEAAKCRRCGLRLSLDESCYGEAYECEGDY
jgi:hypothetical protein